MQKVIHKNIHRYSFINHQGVDDNSGQVALSIHNANHTLIFEIIKLFELFSYLHRGHHELAVLQVHGNHKRKRTSTENT